MSIQIIPVKIKEDIQPSDDIVALILSSSKSSIDDGDVIVISQKIISKKEGRVVNLNSIIHLNSLLEFHLHMRKILD